MVVTDPPDPLADLPRRLAGHDRVISTGTLIDSLRFRVHLADRLRVRPRDVQAMVIGEHGTSEVFLWSSASVGGIAVLDLLGQDGQPLDQLKQEIEHDIRYANITIIEGTGASQYGIGAVSARLAEAVLRDERAVLPVAAYAPRYEVTLSLVSSTLSPHRSLPLAIEGVAITAEASPFALVSTRNRLIPYGGLAVKVEAGSA
jgi:L-lactate dehydrogenase